MKRIIYFEIIILCIIAILLILLFTTKILKRIINNKSLSVCNKLDVLDTIISVLVMTCIVIGVILAYVNFMYLALSAGIKE